MSTTPYAELEERLGLEQGIPYTPDWSAAPDFMGLIVEHALEAKPKVIFECSSGLTTAMLARCCQMNGNGKVISLENGAEYAENTRNYFERYNLDEIATVIDAPLEKIDTNGSEFLWYKTDEINAQLNGHKIDMLVIDGPPGFIQKNSRYPALPILFDQLADGCTVYLDDAVRDDEKQIIKMWLSEYANIEHSYIDTERGCSVLTIHPLKS